MMCARWRGAAAALTLTLAGCASPVKTPELAAIDQSAGYRPNVLDQRAPKLLGDTAVIVTFSGGGTRAAALADGVLRGLAKIEIPGGTERVRLADQIDVISSVSGGSVTAAYYALNGFDGLASLERDFLKQDVMSRLIVDELLSPTTLWGARITALERYFDGVFDHQVYQALIDADKPGRQRRPYVVLNATDITAGSVFSFTQDQFDLLCGDLAKFKIADAVTASAAFPVALTAITLENRAPCQAQRNAATDSRTGWVASSDGRPMPRWIRNYLSAPDQGDIRYPAEINLWRFRRGTTAATYLNQDPAVPKPYIQLIDGGVADNVGLTRPIEMLTTNEAMPSFLNRLNLRQMRRLVLVVVNARSDPPTGYDSSAQPPGITNTLLTTIGTPIDAVTFALIDSLDGILASLSGGKRLDAKALVPVDFDYLADETCRQNFHSIATSWTLKATEVDALIALGETMVLQSPQLKALVSTLGGTVPSPSRSVHEICQMLVAPT
jgi:NTE family protein